MYIYIYAVCIYIDAPIHHVAYLLAHSYDSSIASCVRQESTASILWGELFTEKDPSARDGRGWYREAFGKDRTQEASLWHPVAIMKLVYNGLYFFCIFFHSTNNGL